jgi:hypothetical protein
MSDVLLTRRWFRKVYTRLIMDHIRRLFIWIAIAGLVALAGLLPVLVTGVFRDQPLAGTLTLVGLVLLAFGVAWYVWVRSTRF